VEPQTRLDLPGVGAVPVGEEEPVCRIFEGATLTVRRDGPAVDEILDELALLFLGRDLLRCLAAGQVDQIRVVAFERGVRTKCLVLLFPLSGLFALPVAAQAGRLAVRRPADELRRVARFARQFLGQDAPARAVGLDDDGTPGLDVGVPTAG